jgi:tetratricopeptide (TPR) repeat protein
MKKVLLLVFVLSSFVFGVDFNSISQNISQTAAAQSNKPITQAQSKLEEKKLLQLASYNPKLYWMLGVYYISEYKYADGGYKKPDYEKAKQAFKIASQAGILLADYFLAVIEYKQKNYAGALNILDMALDKVKNPIGNNDYNIISAFYLSIILDKYSDNKELVKKGINTILPSAQQNNVGSNQYLLANAYLRLGMKDSANYWLNKSCLNPKTPSKIKNICKNFKDN